MGRVQKNKYQEIRIELSTVEGHEGVDIRIWQHINGESVPTKKGVWLRRELLPELTGILDEITNFLSQEERRSELSADETQNLFAAVGQ